VGHEVDAVPIRFLYRHPNLVVTELHTVKRIVGLATPPRGGQLDMVSAFSCLLPDRPTYLVNAVCNARKARGAAVANFATTCHVDLVGPARIEMPAGVRDEPARMQQSRPAQQAGLQSGRETNIRASGISNGRKPAIQHPGKRSERERGNVRIASPHRLAEIKIRQPDVDVGIDQPRHQSAPAQVDDLALSRRLDRSAGHGLDPALCNKDLHAGVQLVVAVIHRGIHEKYRGVRSQVPIPSGIRQYKCRAGLPSIRGWFRMGPDRLTRRRQRVLS
jgi:hypothetical protein